MKNYDLQLEKVIENIKDSKAKKVLLQFPDGLKPLSSKVVEELEKETNGKVEFLIWFGSCFGACDTPKINDKEIDLVIQFGHSDLQPTY